MVNLALLGAGRIREVHAQAVVDQAGCAVSAVEAVLPDSRVDSVVICPPTATYFDLIERFACADKAIFCERPIELDVARARARIDVIRETKGRHRSCLPLIVALIHISALCVRQLMLAGGGRQGGNAHDHQLGSCPAAALLYRDVQWHFL